MSFHTTIAEHMNSSLEYYRDEVKSGLLEWSPVHFNEDFWRSNAVKFNHYNYQLLKLLIRHL
ncbi:hypothetical protein Pmani_018011 [Petrolisthes manimaculis]|uniref:ATPase V1 complex subunit H C-terminal domain-containing protein n=1 Tax=Petrolisthes manimaculis TaxID=1843537 RepID=A0AAE1PL19_9EUCA|nr:hypothetical protein Pmani_018011 [Petrolisthes manimaculis]